MHSSSVFQAEVQSAAQVSTFTLPASRPRTEAHLPSPGGEKETVLMLKYHFSLDKMVFFIYLFLKCAFVALSD